MRACSRILKSVVKETLIKWAPAVVKEMSVVKEMCTIEWAPAEDCCGSIDLIENLKAVSAEMSCQSLELLPQ